MLEIYICEDNPAQLSFIKQCVENFISFEDADVRLSVASQTPGAILEHAKTADTCGLYFLDIEYTNSVTNGFDLAKNIRKIEPRCFIVFITSHFELSYQTYQYKVEALDFIIKNTKEETKNRIFECIRDAYAKHAGGSASYKNIFFASMPDGKQLTVKYTDILYLQISGTPHKILMCAKNKVFEFPGQLNNIEPALPDYFFRCHRSTIVNIHNSAIFKFLNNDLESQPLL